MTEFAFDASVRTFSGRNALWLGRAARASSNPPDQARAEVATWGLTEFEYFDQQNTEAFIAGNDQMLILAFPGTADPADWMTDFDLHLVGGPAGKVHQGFQVALLHIWKELWLYVHANRRGRALWVTGHSLGGALATLAVAKLRLEQDEPVNGLYTYGAPRTGDRDFQRTFDADFMPQTFRYVNNSDIVTRVPFRTMGYSHVGTAKIFDQQGVLRNDVSWWDIIVDRFAGNVRDILRHEGPGIRDHNLDGPLGYLENLERNASVL